MQTKYRKRYRRNPDREVAEGRKRREEAVNTRYFWKKQKFGAASKVRTIPLEEYLATAK